MATTVLAVCNLPRNRCHLTRVLSQEKGLFQEFPLFAGISLVRSLSAQGHLWLLAVRMVTPVRSSGRRAAPSGAQAEPQRLGEGMRDGNLLSQKPRALLRSGELFPRPSGVKLSVPLPCLHGLLCHRGACILLISRLNLSAFYRS